MISNISTALTTTSYGNAVPPATVGTVAPSAPGLSGHAASRTGAQAVARSSWARDEPLVVREAARMLSPGGRFALSDVIASASANPNAGLADIEIRRDTHRVHTPATRANTRARKP